MTLGRRGARITEREGDPISKYKGNPADSLSLSFLPTPADQLLFDTPYGFKE